jgi:sulfur carrier protein ThiS
MIKVNNRTQEYFVGMTLKDILINNNFIYEGLILKVNDVLVEDESHLINDNDSILVIHICHGG